MTKRQHTAGFVQPTILHHAVNAPIDAVVEFFTLTLKSDFDDTKRTVCFSTHTKRGVSSTGHITDFQSMDHTFGIADITLGIIVRIKQT